MTWLIAELINLRCHCLECRARLLKCLLASRRKNGEGSLRRALGAATDRCIEIEAPPRLEPGRQLTCGVWGHGRAGHEHGPSRHRVRDPVWAEQDGFGLRRIHHD